MRRCKDCRLRRPLADFWPGALRCVDCLRTWARLLDPRRPVEVQLPKWWADRG